MTRTQNRALAVAGAIALPALLWTGSVVLAGHRLLVADPSGRPPLDVTLPVVLVLAGAAALLGWAALALLERLTRRGTTAWAVLALAVLLLSFAPLTGPGTPLATRLVLGAMHVAVAGALIPVFVRTGRRG